MTAGNSTTAISPRPGPVTTLPTHTTVSYLDIAGLIVGDWLAACPEGNGKPEDVADAILDAFSVDRLHAFVLAHLLA